MLKRDHWRASDLSSIPDDELERKKAADEEIRQQQILAEIAEDIEAAIEANRFSVKVFRNNLTVVVSNNNNKSDYVTEDELVEFVLSLAPPPPQLHIVYEYHNNGPRGIHYLRLGEHAFKKFKRWSESNIKAFQNELVMNMHPRRYVPEINESDFVEIAV